MKYLVPSLFFLVGSEIVSWAVLLVLAVMFMGDIVKEGKWRI